MAVNNRVPPHLRTPGAFSCSRKHLQIPAIMFMAISSGGLREARTNMLIRS